MRTIGWVMTTILPLTALSGAAISSAKVRNRATSASMPSGGVGTVRPRPTIDSFIGYGPTSSALSSPRVHDGLANCSTFTSVKPRAFSLAAPQSLARSMAGEPTRRGPMVVVRSSVMSHAVRSSRALSRRASAVATGSAGLAAAGAAFAGLVSA